MSNSFSVILSGVMFCAVSAVSAAVPELPFRGDDRPARKITIGQAPLHRIPPGSDQLEIVVEAESSPTAKYAGTELKKYLQRKLENTIPIVTAPTPGKISIVLGRGKLAKEAKIDDSRLCRDSFIIRTRKQRIYILGGDDPTADPKSALKGGIWRQYFERGTLFGVYDFLERFAGVRFFFRDPVGVVVPKGTLEIPGIDLFDRPDSENRMVSIYAGKSTADPDQKVDLVVDSDGASFFPDEVTPERNTDFHRLRLQTRYIPNCHGLARLALIQRFGEKHPEYFALTANGKRHNDPKMPHPGQPCFSSGVTDEIYQDAKAFLTGQSAASRNITTPWGQIWDPTGHGQNCFGLMPQDSYYKCRCDKCLIARGSTDQSESDFLWDFVIDTAEKLKAEQIPGFVTCMSYWPYHLVPKRAIPDNVWVMVATRGPWGINSPMQEEENERIRKWTEKLNRKVWLWNYTIKYGRTAMPGIPHSTPRRIGAYYKEIAPYIYGAYLQSNGDYYIFNYLNHYIFAKMLWDNSADPEKLLKDHYRAMFGAAAPELEKIFNRFEELWTKKIVGKIIVTDIGPIGVTPSDHELFGKIYSKAEISSLDKAFDRAEKSVEEEKETLARIRFIRSSFLGRIKRAAQEYTKRSDTVADFQYRAVGLTPEEKIVLDGKVEENAWKNRLPMWLQRIHTNNPAPNDESQVWITRDAKNLYLAGRFKEPEMAALNAGKHPHDHPELWKENGVEIFLNPSGDRRIYYQIILNSEGSVNDRRAERNGNTSLHDIRWNGTFQSRVFKGADFWSWEMAIPLKDLPGFDAGKLLANVVRTQSKKAGTAYYSWSPFLVGGNHDVEHFGRILFTPPERKNLVRDGSFEENRQGKNVFGNWTAPNSFPPDCNVQYDRSTFISGRQSLRITSGGQNWFYVNQQIPELKPNTRYRLSYYVKLDNVKALRRNGGVCLNIMDDKNCWFPASETWLTGTTPWLRQSFEFTSGAKTNTGKFKSYLRPDLLNCTGSANFDHIILEEIQ